MNRWILAALVAIVGGGAVLGLRTWLAPNELCQAANAAAADINNRAPFLVDEITSVIGADVDCDSEVFQYRRQLGVDPDALAPGWVERKGAEHRTLHCNAQGLASVSGWTVRDVVAGPDGVVFQTFETTPADCA